MNNPNLTKFISTAAPRVIAWCIVQALYCSLLFVLAENLPAYTFVRLLLATHISGFYAITLYLFLYRPQSK